MSMLAFATARSSPGVTTAVLACASVWPGQVLLVEAADDGGVLAARFGLADQPGLATLAAAIRHAETPDADTLWAHTQPLPGTDGRIAALIAPSAPEPAQLLLRTVAPRLSRLLATAEATVLVDCGRLAIQPTAAPLIGGCEWLVLIARPRIEELLALANRSAELAGMGTSVGLILVGEQPYDAREVAGALGLRVFGVLAHDPHAADTLAAVAPSRRLDRCDLLRSAVPIVEEFTGERPPVEQPDTSPVAVPQGLTAPQET